MRVEDVFVQNRRLWVRLHEKGGKRHEMPCHHNLDEPTRGVDVGAKREIYRIVCDFAAEGGTVVMISSEIDEVLGLSDRIMVMRGGRSAGILGRGEGSAQSLVHLST